MIRSMPPAPGLAPAPYQVVATHSESFGLRTELWSQELSKLGMELPGFVVNDLGLLLALPREQLTLREASPLAAHHPARAVHDKYSGLVSDFAQCQVCSDAKSLRPNDSMVVALLARLLSRTAAACSGYLSDPERYAVELMLALARDRLYLLTLADSLDTDTLRLVGMLGGDASSGSLGIVDLLASLGSPETNSMVQFSLQILPSVLEAKRKTAASNFAAFGYAGLARQGSIDSLMLTELCWDEEELTRRLMENEVLYYAREQGQRETRRHHHLLIDATASMRGQRATFARGIALATAKKLLLAGDDVTLRFFDSRLYEAHRCPRGQIPITHLLSFKGERGRNPRRVFSELASYLDVAKNDGREQVVHLLTHAGLYIPREQIERLRRTASVLGVFILPSQGKLELAYTDLLDHHWVVDEEALRGGAEQTEAAERILHEVGEAKSVRFAAGARTVEQRPTLSQRS